MRERTKEYLQTLACTVAFIGCTYLAIKADVITSYTEGDPQKARFALLMFALGFLFTAMLSWIGDFRLNVWFRPAAFLESKKGTDEYEAYINEKGIHFVTLAMIATLIYVGKNCLLFAHCLGH